MNDVERDLRELFERKAGSLGGVAPRLPDRVRKRGRRRQLGTALVGGVTALAVVVGSVAALRAIQTDADRGQTPVDDPWAGYEVFERTATVGNFTISSPSDWYLVNQWPWARTAETRLELRAGNRLTPILLLSDTDRGLESSPCLRSSFPIRPGDAVMTLAFDNAHFAANFGAGDRAQWPVSFDSSSEAERPSCGPGTYVYFAAGDIPYVAHFAFGDAVPDDERQTLIDAFEGMRVADSQEVFMQEPNPDDTSAYVIAGGENAAGPWTLELSPQSDPGYVTNVRLELTTAEGSGAVAGGPFTVYEERPIEQAGGDPVFGAVVKEADAVELRLEEGTPPIPAQIVPLPPSMPFEFDLFFASNPTDVPAVAVAVAVAVADDGDAIQPTDPSSNRLTFLDEVDHQPSGQTWAPATIREGDMIVMPITFPDGTTAEAVYPSDLGLDGFNVYPDAYANLEAGSGACGWPVHASRSDPREDWARGAGPLDSHTRIDGTVVELWQGKPWTRPHNILVTRFGRWNVIVLCRAQAMIPEVVLWAEHLGAHTSRDGLLVLEDSLPLEAHPGDTGATIRFSGPDVVVDLEVSPDDCRNGGATDLGSADGVVEWCVGGNVHVYANAFEPRQHAFLERLTADLTVRNVRPPAGG